MSYECCKKILEQMTKNICKINIGEERGTGFFCKIPFPNKDNMLPVFITNNHLINEKLLNEDNGKINIKIKEGESEKVIKLNNRIKYNSIKYDITIIEIKENDDINDFMELDEGIIDDIINNKNLNSQYKDETLYITQYPEGNLSVSYGILKQIFEDKPHNFLHKCSTRKGSSGSPIINLKNKIIGIHNKGYDKNYNEGTFLNYPIKEFIAKNYFNTLKINYKMKEDLDNYLTEINNIEFNNDFNINKEENYMVENLENLIIFKRYRITQKLTGNSFNNTYKGYDIKTKEQVAIKIGAKETVKPLLEIEGYFLYKLKGLGIPEVLSFGMKNNCYILITPLLGKSLFDIFMEYKKSMSLIDICLISQQIIDRIQWVHSKSFIHRDIKPTNFLIGRKDQNIIYLVNFGLGRKYKSDRTGNNLKFSYTGKLTGNIKFASVNALRGFVQSCRDDLESIAYMIIYFM